MVFDFNHTLFALSYALDCVEHDLLGVTTNHGKRVAALAILTGREMDLPVDEIWKQELAACAIMHDCALSEYVQEEFNGSAQQAAQALPRDARAHCTMGEETMQFLPFPYAHIKNAVLYHHENADGSGAFGKRSEDIPQMARLIQIADTVDAKQDLSWMDNAKRKKVSAFVKDHTGEWFAPTEAQAVLHLLQGRELENLRNEKIDLYLQKIFPGGGMECTPEQLEQFAGIFARITDYKSHFTKTHSIGIAHKAKEMALYYGADRELAAKLFFAGAVHDIGKLVVDLDILEKPDRLNNEEYRHIQTHAYYSYKILSDIQGMEDITRWAVHHHEKLDGTGYPFGLKGNVLGKWERLMACLDIYQALTEERPYKAGMPHRQAMEILEDMVRANKLDGQIVEDIDHYYGKAPTGDAPVNRDDSAGRENHAI
jgi:HD-GYP domain-containing protein (c-di-GMP phosphodiesterase class II)